MPDATNDEVWRKLFRALPDKPLGALLGEPAPAAPPWNEVRAKAAHLLDAPSADLAPPLAAVVRAWGDVGTEVTGDRLAPYWAKLRAMALDAPAAHTALDGFERELGDALAGCGPKTAVAVWSAAPRSPRPGDPSPSPEERRRGLLRFLAWLAARTPAAD